VEVDRGRAALLLLADGSCGAAADTGTALFLLELPGIASPRCTHGTPTGWRWHRCRCSACHRALLDEAQIAWAMRQVRRGRDRATRVPVARARKHVAELEEAGLTKADVAKRATVSPATISRMAARGTRRVSRIVVAAVMAVPLP
jgi:hypothetical protein